MRMTFALLELNFISTAFVLCSVATHAAVTLTSPPSGAEFVAPAEVLLAEGTSAPEPSTTNTVIATGSAWNYLDDGSNQGTAWIAPEFDDSAWKTGPAQLGYGDGDEATVIGFGPDPNNKFVTSYFRRQFNIEDPALVESLTLNLLRDDGAIAYINGEEVFRLSMAAGPVDYRTYATTASEYGFESTTVSPTVLRAGPNTIAVEVHQCNASSSDLSFELELIGVFAAPTNAKPVVSLTSPPDNLTLAAPAAVTLQAGASDRDGTVTNVVFYADGIELGADRTDPYTYDWAAIPAGAYQLTAVATDNVGLSATSRVVRLTVSTDTAPPLVADKSPAPGTVTSLTQITVTFSKVVTGVDAGDLRVNGMPATGLAGSGHTYTFTFPEPSFGPVAITWSAQAGIVDVFTPPHPFDPNGLGATWSYTLVDAEPPYLTLVDPVPGATVAALDGIRIAFSEPVTGVQAGDLLVNGSPASTLEGAGAGPYRFGFAQPAPGAVQVAWLVGHGIRDLSGNPFSGGAWSCTLDTNATGVVISEIMYHPASENVLEEYIELHNKGAMSVDLAGWQFSAGVQFTFPSVSIPAGGYLVVAADLPTFASKHPGVSNVVGGWLGNLSNTREDIDLDDAAGQRVDSVFYADEGDWAVRQRDYPDMGFRGWVWDCGHDGTGRSAELVNPALSNNSGQNWAASLVPEGTPGQPNSVRTNDLAPMILDAAHFPILPRSTQSVVVTTRIMDETADSFVVRLHYRVDSATPPPFSPLPMTDDGLGGDAAGADGVYTAVVPPQPNNAVVEFYIEAADFSGHSRTWPAAAVETNGVVMGQTANLLYQVDDNSQNQFAGGQPVYKLIMTEGERSTLASIPGISTVSGPDSQMNGTFISQDGTGTELRYLVGLRNRGHGTRRANPPNYRVNFRSDNAWKDVVALNLNSVQVQSQHFGSLLARQAGIDGPTSIPVQVRVNNANRAVAGSPMFGSYAANEVVNGDWARRHVPSDSDGNIYRVIRDIAPPELDYRTQAAFPQLYGPENHNSYTNTWFKESNVSEDDWTDLISMLRVMGLSGITEFNSPNVRQVVNVEQWLRHLAVMNLLGNSETGLNSGYNDDYLMYRGEQDPRFILLYWDLDQILGINSFASNAGLFSATQNSGSGRAINRFMHWPEFEPLYYRILQDLLDTAFSAEQFNALIDQTLGGYVQAGTINTMKNYMDARRVFVQSQIAGLVPPPSVAPVATLTGVPRSPTPFAAATITVGGTDITHYRFSLNQGAFGSETAVGTPILLAGLASGTNVLAVIGKTGGGLWQEMTSTTTRAWVVNTAWPSVRINEVLARNDTAVNHQGTFPDIIELYNEGPSAVDLSGLRLTDDPAQPDKFVFPQTTTLASGGYLVVYANNPDNTSGFHLGFGLSEDGESVYLFDRAARGGALLDSVRFGLQIPDRGIGRLGGGGEWILTQPTAGGANLAQPLAQTRTLRINEWLAFPQVSLANDFVELFNPDPLPADLGGLFLTDQPNGAPTRHAIAPLSYVAGHGYQVFLADGDPGQGARHLSFRLAAEQGEIGLVGVDLRRIDSVVYGPQTPDVSQGRCPDGGVGQRFLVVPTPGAPNLCPVQPPSPQLINLLPMASEWRYERTGTNLGTAWFQPGYDDSAWPLGPALLGQETAALPAPGLRTSFPGYSNVQITYYFRTTFVAPAGLNGPSMSLTTVLDDGAVIYLNGAELYRIRMPGGSIDYLTQASGVVSDAVQESWSVPGGALAQGTNVLAVEVHQGSIPSSDIVFGLSLDVVIVTNSPVLAGVLINEVLANNATFEDPDGSRPDWLEIYNPSTNSVDLADLSLSDSTLDSRRWIFPPGSIVPARGFLPVRSDGNAPASPTNTGFGLKAEGGSVFLFAGQADGGGVLSWITYGLQPADWSIGRVPDGSTNWTLTLPSLGGSNLPVTLASPLNLKINEWMADPAGGDDWFELYNPNPQPVDISGLHLTDQLDNPSQSSIRALSFLGTGADGYQKFVADGNADAGGDHVGFALRAGGEALGLATADATTFIDSLVFLRQQTGVSEGRFPDGTATWTRFPVSASPGRSNYLPLQDVVVNEVLTHSDLFLEDAVEFYNQGGDDVDIGGWWLSDSEQNLRKYRVPPNTVVPAGGYFVFYENQFNGPDADTRFAFSSARGDDFYLSQTDAGGNLTGYRAAASFGAAANGVSFGRFLTSQGTHFVSLASRTFGVDNPTNLAHFRTGTGRTNSYARVGPVVISEIMYNPLGTNQSLEFLELQNITPTNVFLFDPVNPANTWRLRGGVDFNFPTGLSVPPGGFLIVVPFGPATDPLTLAEFQARYGTSYTLVGPYTGNLNNGGETVELRCPDPPQTSPGPDFGLVPYVVIDRIDYGDGAPWPAAADGFGYSLQKSDSALYGNDPVHWIASSPSPGSSGSGVTDSDGDGMPDEWEVAHGLNPSRNDAGEDLDLDGMTNLEEYLAGTDPQSPSSVLQVTLDGVAGGTATLRFTAVAGKTYTVQYRASLTTGAWQKLADVPPGAVSRLVVIPDPMAGGASQRFYRLVTPQTPGP